MFDTKTIIIISFLGLLYVIVTTKLSISLSHKFGILAVPGKRSSHDTPTPTIGGVGFVTALILFSVGVLILKSYTLPLRLISGGILVALVGFVDDWRGMPVTVKLACQAISGIIPVYLLFGATVFETPLFVIFAVSWIVFVQNVTNFMDGINGLAGVFGICVALFLIAMAAFLMENDPAFESLRMLLLLLIVGLAVFLRYNVTPAQVFMGDTGSQFLGYFLAVSSIVIARNCRIEGEFSSALIGTAMVMFPFIYDVLFTLGRRLIRGANIMSAHREHLYQKLVKSGYTHSKVVAIHLLLFSACAIAGLIYVWQSNAILRFFLLTACVSIMIVYTALVENVEKKAQK